MNEIQPAPRSRSLSNVPFAPARSPVFYGWIILLAGTIGMVMSIPGQTMGVSVFTDFLIDALKISRDQISFAYLLGTTISAFLLRRAGMLYDHFGARTMAFVTAVMLALVLLLFSRIDRLAFFLQGTIPAVAPAAVTVAVLICGFFLLRFLGQGVLTMVSRNMVMKWFDHHRGLANGIMGVFVSFGFSFSPRLINQMIEGFSWRDAWVIMAGVIGIAFALLVLILFRDNPEECGCLPDGKIKTPGKRRTSPSTAPRDYTLTEARGTFSFWIFTLVLTLFSLYITAMTFHIVSIFESSGMTRTEAIAIFLPASVISVAFHLFGSWISDYIRLKYILLVHAAGLMLSMGALSFLGQSPVPLWILITGNGIAGGTFGILSSVTWPRFFGLKHLGEIAGYSLAWAVAGSALGPFLFSLSFSHLGSYAPAAAACFVIALVLFFLAFRADNVNE